MKKVSRPWSGRWIPTDLAPLRRQQSEIKGAEAAKIELVSSEPERS